MGFPVGCADLFLPKLIVYLLTILGFIHRFTQILLSILGQSEFLDSETASYPVRSDSGRAEPRSASAALIQELLPVVKFSDLAAEAEEEVQEKCAVCLYEFGGEDEIRPLANCRHIFHRSCLDRWMEHDQKTCPLCRAIFVPDEMQATFNEKLWLASGISDLYGEYLPITTAWYVECKYYKENGKSCGMQKKRSRKFFHHVSFGRKTPPEAPWLLEPPSEGRRRQRAEARAAFTADFFIGHVEIHDFLRALRLKPCGLSEKMFEFIDVQKTGKITFKQFLIGSAHVLKQRLFRRACDVAFGECYITLFPFHIWVGESGHSLVIYCVLPLPICADFWVVS